MGSASQPLVEHWDGRSWSLVGAPGVGDVSFLQGVEATASADVWAVGYHYDLGKPAQTLIEHWDGAVWTVVPSPSVGANSNYLLAVTAGGPADVWAAGYYYAEPFEDSQRTLVEHWDGVAWTVDSSPNHGTHANFLQSVTAVSPTDVWAVGYYNPGDGSVLDRTLTLHWDGSAWTTTFSPDAGDNENILLGVAALSSTDVWAVGYYDNEGGGFQALAEHWDGATWLVDIPLDLSQGRMRGAAAVGGIATLAVGDSSSQTLTEVRRNRWTRLASPNVGTGFNSVTAAASTSARDVWAVGSYFDSLTVTYKTLVLHRCRSGATVQY